MLNEAHGHSSIQWQDKRLTLSLEGSFNVEGVVCANNKIKKFITDNAVEAWYLIIKLAPETLLTADSISEVRNIMRWVAKHGCQFVAYITKEQFFEDLISKIFEDIDLEFKIFTSVDLAYKSFLSPESTN